MNGSPLRQQIANWYAVKWSISPLTTSASGNVSHSPSLWKKADGDFAYIMRVRASPPLVKCDSDVCMKKAWKVSLWAGSVCVRAAEWQNKRAAEAAIFLHMCCHRLVVRDLYICLFQYHFGAEREGTLLLACGKNHLSIYARERADGRKEPQAEPLPAASWIMKLS